MIKVAEVDDLTVRELKAELRKMGASGYSRMRKDELRKILKKEIRKKQRSSRRRKSVRRLTRKRSPKRTLPSTIMQNVETEENYIRAQRARGKQVPIRNPPRFSPSTRNPYSLSPGVAKEISLAKTYNSLPKSRKSKRKEVRDLDPEDGRGSPTRGWGGRNPQRGQERNELMEECGKMCFLKPESKGYPVCAALRTGQGCNYDCGGLQAAYNRARQRGEQKIATRAQRLLNQKGCSVRR